MFSQPGLEKKTSVLDDSANGGFHSMLSFKKKKIVIHVQAVKFAVSTQKSQLFHHMEYLSYILSMLWCLGTLYSLKYRLVIVLRSTYYFSC